MSKPGAIAYMVENFKYSESEVPAYFGIVFLSLGFLGLGKVDTGYWVVFVMRCCPIFLDFLLVPTITLARFSLISVMGDIAVDMSQGIVFVCASFVCYIARN